MIEIDFHDAIYQETGIDAESVAMREVPVETGDGRRLTLQAVKRNVGGEQTLYISLKNSHGVYVHDLSVQVGAQTLAMDRQRSSTAVVIDHVENLDLQTRRNLSVRSPSQGLDAPFAVGLEGEGQARER